MSGDYEHTQRAPLFWLLVGLGLALFFLLRTDPEAPAWTPWLPLAILLPLALSFKTLTVRDIGVGVEVRFGPLPLFKTRVLYADLKRALRDRSTFMDGWGIHYRPGQGWIYNLWGFHCVRIIREGKKPIRIGTDDAQCLADFLNSRAGARD